MIIRSLLFAGAFVACTLTLPTLTMASGCGEKVIIAGKEFSALNCCRCKSGGSPCRCGRTTGYTSCDCSTQCTTGYNDEEALIRAAMADSAIPQLTVSTGSPATILFGGQVHAAQFANEIAMESPRWIQFIIKVPSGRLYSQAVSVGKEFTMEITTAEFDLASERNISKIELGEFVVEHDQRTYLISLDRTY
jgi:hypothetical protein